MFLLSLWREDGCWIEVSKDSVGEILIDLQDQRKISLSNAVCIVGRQSDLNGVVDVVPIGVVVCLLRARCNETHELPGAPKIFELQVSGQLILFTSPAGMGLKSRRYLRECHGIHCVRLFSMTPDSR